MFDASWKPEYSLGHSLIDKEHKYLFEIASGAFKPVRPELRKTKIKNTINSLHEYIKVHFSHEESFMRVIEYPYINNHLLIHKSIINKMESLLTKLYTLNIKEFEQSLAFFVETSLIGHILQEDKKIHTWYSNKKGQRHIVDWNDKYLIGEEQIDKDHSMLFKLANEAFVEGDKNNSKEKIKDIIDKLSLYTSTHFTNEEAFMKKIGYPQYELHCEKHKKIIKEMKAFVKLLNSMDSKTYELELELAMFIEKCFVQHIIYEDKKIKNFIDLDIKQIKEL
ncbi:MAG: hemerythrin [Sulfurimonas sp.]|jgi:hemerythrin